MFGYLYVLFVRVYAQDPDQHLVTKVCSIQSINLLYVFQNVASATIDGTTGIVKSVSMLGTNIPLEQNFYYYKSSGGNNTEFVYRASGAYIFRPEINSNLTLINAKPKVEMFSGIFKLIYYVMVIVLLSTANMNSDSNKQINVIVNRIFINM